MSSMKTLIAVASCIRDTENGYNQAIRETWKTEVPDGTDFRFFVGNIESPVNLLPDEVLLDCKDGYFDLPWKTQAILRWALENNYTHILKCDTDTYARPRKILQSNFAAYDYVGHFNGLVDGVRIGQPNSVYGSCYPWASGGSGYWLSSRAAELVVSNPPDAKWVCPNLKYPCEDLGVGMTLGPKLESGEFIALDDSRYWRSWRKNYQVYFTAHYCSEGEKREFDVSWMYSHWKVNRDRP
jgi:hypothetical protein